MIKKLIEPKSNKSKIRKISFKGKSYQTAIFCNFLSHLIIKYLKINKKKGKIPRIISSSTNSN